MSVLELEKIFSEVPLSGRYIFRDSFESLDNWDVVAGSATISNSILTLSGSGAEIRSKRKFLYGVLVAVARSDAAGNLQIGFSDGGNDRLVWSGGYLRYASSVDPTEGTTSAGATETSYNVFVILWEPDNVCIWINGTFYGPYQGVKIPNKPLSISIKNLSTGTSYVDFVVLYPEPAGAWITTGPAANTWNLAIPVIPLSTTHRVGIFLPSARLLATPYTDTTTALGANASYTGTARDTQISGSSPYDYFVYINAHAVSDVSGTLMIQESPDGSTWVTVRNEPTSAVTNPDGTTVQVAAIHMHPVTLRYVRVAYRNGATAQTSFRLSSRVFAI